MRPRRAMIAGALAMYSAVAIALASAVSCGLDEDGLGGPGADASVFDASGGDAPGSGDDGAAGDADAEPPILPCPDAALPLCDDASSECASGTTCTPPVPTGWRIVSYASPTSGADGGCGAAYADLLDGGRAVVAMLDAGAAQCGCTCTKTAESTCAATVSIALGDSTSGPCGLTPATNVQSNACAAFAPTATPNGGTSFTLRGTQGATLPSCAPVSAEFRPPVDGGGASVCRLATEPAGLCDRHHFCAPSPPAGEKVCVAHDGLADCPAGYVRTTAAVGLGDDRSCASCTCTPSAGACTGRFTAHPNSASCGADPFTSPFTAVYDGGCNVVNVAYPGNVNFADTDASPPVGTCAPSAAVATGSYDAGAITTICCAP